MKGRPEALLEREVLAALGRVPDLSLYRNEVGEGHPGMIGRLLGQELGDYPEAQAIVRGVLMRHRLAWGMGNGSPDLVGAIAGRALGLELKSGAGRLSPDQERWHAAARERGGWGIYVVRSVDEAREALVRARRGVLQ